MESIVVSVSQNGLAPSIDEIGSVSCWGNYMATPLINHTKRNSATEIGLAS